MIADTLALLEHQFKVAHIQVQPELYENLPLIQGNAGRLQQVFLNLFLNAKDAMAGGGVLNVATLNGEFVSVRVSDTGSGIAQEHIQRIYLRHHPGTRGQYPRGEPPGRRHHLHPGFPVDQEGSPCLS